MCFYVPKVVWSPGCDHGHDEESRNGRDIKIDILEACIWLSEVFRVKSGFYRSTGGYRNPPGGFNGPTWALVEKRRGRQGRAARPSPLVRIGQGEGGGAPLSFLSPSSFPPSPNPTRKGGSPTPGGSRTPPGAPPPGRPHLPLAPLYTGAGGTPKTQQLI